MSDLIWKDEFNLNIKGSELEKLLGLEKYKMFIDKIYQNLQIPNEKVKTNESN